MKKTAQTAVLCCMFLSSAALCVLQAEDAALKDNLKAFANPLEGKALAVTETINFADDVFATILADNAGAKNGEVYSFIYSFGKEGIHLQEKFSMPDGKQNIRNVYLHKNSVYVKDSLTPDFVAVYDPDSMDIFPVQRLYEAYFSVFSLPKEASESKTLEVGRSQNELTLCWPDGTKSKLLSLDLNTLLPKALEVTAPNGDIIEKSNIKKAGDGFEITRTVYNPGGKLFTVSKLEVKAVESPGFEKAVFSEKNGFCMVLDTRGNERRKYYIYDNFPDKSFLDDLFKNSDDVARYNNEMHRLAHPHESE